MISLIFYLQLLSEACGPEMTLKLMLPTILNMAGDNVPNVRFNVAKSILRLGKMLDQRYASIGAPSVMNNGL